MKINKEQFLVKYDLHQKWLADGLSGAMLDEQLGREPKDYDFFFVNQVDLDNVINIFGGKEVRIKDTAFAVTYIVDGKIVQIIKRLYDTPFEIVESFDFTPLMIFKDKNGVFVHSFAEKAVKDKVVRSNSLKTPLHSLNRLLKYKRMGWDYACAAEDFGHEIANGVNPFSGDYY